MEIDTEIYRLLLENGEYEVVWRAKPSRDMKLRGWTDALFTKLLGSSLYTCSSAPDEPICSKDTMWAGEHSVDLATHQIAVAKRRRKRERARFKLIKANGYQGSDLSEISARFSILKKEVPKIMKHAESFTRVYSRLLRNANYHLTRMYAGSGFYSGNDNWKSIDPGQRKFCKPALFISIRLGDCEQLRVQITSQGVYLPHKQPIPNRPGRVRVRYKKAVVGKPASVITVFQNAGIQVNGHDTFAIHTDFEKHSRKTKAKKRRRR
jgi:hypothetical protein